MADGLDIDLQGDPDKSGGRPTSSRAADWWGELVRSWGPVILIVLVIRSIVVEAFQIPSGSMVPTLAIGDFILVSKFTYGLRVPFTDIEVLPLGEPERGDVVVFIYPPTQSQDPLCSVKRIPRMVSFGRLPGPDECATDYIKRIVGMPGDTVEVRDSVVYVNGVEQVRTRDGNYPYTDVTCRAEDMQSYTEDLGGLKHPVLQSASFVRRMQDYLPVTVPPGHYFVMGDNRDNSADSRIWGFVPRENIRGKAMFVFLSFDGCSSTLGDGRGLGKVRIDRLGQGIE